MREISLKNGRIAIIDDEDYEIVSQYRWYLLKGKNTEYACHKKTENAISLPTILMHRLVMNAPKGSQIDHINGDGLDNRKCNLRFCSHQENSRNSPKNWRGTSKYKGVGLCKRRKKWRARIKLNNKQVEIGCYNTEIEAATAYNMVALANFRQFARLNYIP